MRGLFVASLLCCGCMNGCVGGGDTHPAMYQTPIVAGRPGFQETPSVISQSSGGTAGFGSIDPVPAKSVAGSVSSDAAINAGFDISNAYLISQIVSDKLERGDTDPRFSAMSLTIINRVACPVVYLIGAKLCQPEETTEAVKLLEVSLYQGPITILTSATPDEDHCWNLIPTGETVFVEGKSESFMAIRATFDASVIDPAGSSNLFMAYASISALPVLELKQIVFASSTSNEVLSVVAD